MNNLRVLIICCFSLIFSVKSFSQAYDTYVDYKKNKVPAAALVADVPDAVAQTALDEDFKRSGLKGKYVNGYKFYERVIFPPFGKNTLNIYTTVKKDSEKSSNRCIVYIMAEKINEGFVDKNENSQIFENIKHYLDTFHPVAQSMHLEIRITDQEKTVAKAQKKLEYMVRDSANIAFQISELETRAEEVQTEMELQRKKVEMQLQVLENLYSESK